MGKRGDPNAKPPGKVPHGGGRKRRTGDAGDAPGASAAAQLARLSDPQSFQCGTCHVTDANQAVSDAAVPTCSECFNRYSKGFTQFGTLEVVQDGVNDEGSHIHECWEESKSIEKGDASKEFAREGTGGRAPVCAAARRVADFKR